MIGVAGLARSGKDTLSKCLKKIIEREFKCDVEIIHLADKLKSDLDKVIACNFNFQVFTENDTEKELIRPILVAYGEAMKKKWGKDIWVKKLNDSLKSRIYKKFYIVSDVRFDFEAKFFQEEMDGFVIHINKIGNEDAVNDVEKINDPLVAAECNLTHAWPPYEPDQMDECDGHAEILWQMIPEELKEKWKKTIN